ncbi:MAG: hypothetical protein MRY74_07160 [Neomegalonema sp.]|nr:hypothetical protein [Neomegalonema sp.]
MLGFLRRVFTRGNRKRRIASKLNRLWRREGGRLAKASGRRPISDPYSRETGSLVPFTRDAALTVIDISPNKTDDEFAEHAIAGAAAFIFDYSDEHFSNLNKLRHQRQIPDRNLVSADLLLDKKVSRHMKRRVMEFRNRIRFAISAIAHAVEVREDHFVLSQVRKSRMGPESKQRVERLSAGKTDVNVSLRSITIALEVFKRLNYLLIEESRHAGSQTDALEINLRSCIIVVETLDTIIGLLEHFRLRGEDELKTLQREVFADLDRGDQADAHLLTQAKQESDALTQEQVMRNVEARKAGRALARTKWLHIETSLSSAKSGIDKSRSRISALKLRRDDAQNQADFLQTMSVTLLADQSVAAVEHLINMGDMSIEYLSAEQYSDLLNLGGHADEFGRLPDFTGSN